MANPYFQFKQFTVHQDRSTLKVSTDSCIFGAWVAEKCRELWAGSPSAIPYRILDIGVGTGLLMLMMAQQCDGVIDGIEIDGNAFEQARENIQASPWGDRLRIFHGDVKYTPIPGAWDLIISNPPFFEGDLTSPAMHKNLAKHDAGLTLDALLEAAGRLSIPTGRLAVLLPWHRTGYFLQLALSQSWYAGQQLLIRQTPSHDYFRTVLLLQKDDPGAVITETLVIHNTDRSYSERMVALMKPYYLHL